jgi:formate dehydrogenase iron-sulfur subunit
MGILVDTTRCTGCEDCVAACKEVNSLGEDVPRRWKARIDDLSSTRYTTMLQREGRHIRQFCRHCLEPACASACIVGALIKTPGGAVIYDADKCMGCRYCMNACPYGIPRYDWEKAVPYVRKCHLCADRVAAGGIPACVEACTYDVTQFGPREELLRIAHERIAAEPEKYQQKVWGEHEVGGTSVIYISDIPLDFLGWKPNLEERPLPERTWAALSKVPPIIAGVAGLMAGTYWIIGRRMKLAAEAAEEER